MFSATTQFPIGCIIKPLLALITLELHVRGELNIHAPVSELLPELASAADERGAITIAHLLSHTAGYIEPQSASARWALTWDDFKDAYVNRRQAFLPGEVFSYTQTGHAVVARIVERVVNTDPIALIEQMILDPIGVRLGREERRAAELTSLHIYKGGRYEAVRLPRENMLLRTSISARTLSTIQMVRIGRLFQGDRTATAISADAFRLFSEPTVTVPAASGSSLREACPSAFGLGLAHYGRLRGHSGSYVGAACSVRADPLSGSVFAFGSNAWCPGLRDQLVSNLFYTVTGAREFITRTRCPSPAVLEPFAGDYSALMLGMGTASANVDDGALKFEIRLPTGTTSASLRMDADGFLSGKLAQANMTIAIAHTPRTSEPYLLIGMSAYKKG